MPDNLFKEDNMQALGRQVLAEFYDCNDKILNDTELVSDIMVEGTKKSNATIISSEFHHFSPHGVSGVIIIGESHVAVHTWPEYSYAAVDIFTCGDTVDPWIIFSYIEAGFEAGYSSKTELKRGLMNVKEGDVLKHKP